MSKLKDLNEELGAVLFDVEWAGFDYASPALQKLSKYVKNPITKARAKKNIYYKNTSKCTKLYSIIINKIY